MAMKTKVLFLCTENSCRTQMAEAFLREQAGDELEIVSAGSEAGHLDPEAVAAMQEVGIDISSARTKSVNPYLGERFNYVITLCNRQVERSLRISSKNITLILGRETPHGRKRNGTNEIRRGGPSR
jgi:arsenate reductase